jgi:hypothetical protein
MKVQLAWFGKAAGRSAGTIYQTYFGNTYTRAMPFSFHYPDTKKQQETQASFFDIQRNWFPIYNQIKLHIDMSQKKNKNVFNQLSKAIYKILNPYKKSKLINPIENFGLDPLNQNKPVVIGFRLDFKEKDIVLNFNMARPIWVRSEWIESTHILLFNRTQQTMMYQETKFQPDTNIIGFENLQRWENSDKIFTYMALSSQNYLANFNLIN